MVELHPQILQKDGRNEFVVLPYEEFERLREMIEDYEDLRDLQEAVAEERTVPTLTLEETRARLGL